jgi:hypothetical protein
VLRSGGNLLYDFEMEEWGSPTAEGRTRIEAMHSGAAEQERSLRQGAGSSGDPLGRWIARTLGVDYAFRVQYVMWGEQRPEPALVQELSTLESIEILSFRNAAFGDTELRAITRMPRLSRLGMEQGQATDEGLAALAGNDRLWSLSIAKNPGVTDRSIGVIGGLKLRHLHLDGTTIRARGWRGCR